MEDTKEDLLSKGWRQGSCIKVEEIAELHTLVAKIEPEQCSQFIAISVLYDCALVSPSFVDEPYAHFVVIKELGAPDNQYLNGKNPRKLHLPLTVSNSEKFYEATPMGLMLINREELFSHEPSLDYEITDEQMNILTHWLSRRYRTPSFPDNFNARLEKRNTGRLFKKYDDVISGVYIEVQPMKEELKEGDRYRVSVITAVSDGELRGLRESKKEDEIKMAVQALFSEQKAFDLFYNEVSEEGSITLKMLRQHKLWSPEYYTHRGKAQEFPVETTGSGTQ